MKISDKQTENFSDVIAKLDRYFAYKYKVMTKEVTLMTMNKRLHVLISGKLKESVHLKEIKEFRINETDGAYSPKY